MEYFGTGDFWSVYALPVPFRRWMLERKIKELQKQQPNNSSDKPMTASEKAKFSRDSAMMRGTPGGSPPGGPKGKK